MVRDGEMVGCEKEIKNIYIKPEVDINKKLMRVPTNPNNII